MSHELENIYTFIETHVKGPWMQRGEDMTIYRGPEERFVVRRETAASNLSLWRYEVLGEAGVDCTRSDTEEFAKRFMQTIGDYLSPYDIVIMIKHMQLYIDKWNEGQARFDRPPLTLESIDSRQ